MAYMYMVAGKVAFQISGQQDVADFSFIFGTNKKDKFKQSHLVNLNKMLAAKFYNTLSEQDRQALQEVQGMVLSISFLGNMKPEEFYDCQENTEEEKEVK